MIKHIINKWEQSEWILIFSEFFEWDKYGRLKEQQQTTYETKDSLPFTYITEYLYSISNDSNLINIQLVINGYKSDSLNGKSYKIFENDTKGLLVSFLSGNIYGGREVIIERDKYFNVISVRDKNWQQEKWKYEEIMNVIYRKKEH